MIVIHREMRRVEVSRSTKSMAERVLNAISGEKCTLYKLHNATGINELRLVALLEALITQGKVTKRDSTRKTTQFVTYFYSKV